jgi:hypothetical protein
MNTTERSVHPHDVGRLLKEDPMNKPSPGRRPRRRGTAVAPTASIRIIGDHVAVNGRSLHVDDQDVYAAAIAEVARGTARPLGQAVRTVATADGHSSILLVHPDGRAEVLDNESGAPLALDGREDLAVAETAAPVTRPDRRARLWLTRTRTPALGASALAAAACIAIAGAIAVGGDTTGQNEDPAPAAVSSPTAAQSIPTPATETAGPVVTPVARTLRVRARATDSSDLVLTIRVSDRPARITVRAAPTPSPTSGGGGPRGERRLARERSLVVPKDTRELRLVLRDLAPGPWQWKVSSSRATTVRGRTRIPGQPASPTAPTPDATPETSSPVPTYPTQQPTQQPSQPGQQPTKPPPPAPVDPNQNPIPG